MHGRASSGSSTAGTRATRARQRMDKSGPRRPAGTARPHVVRGGSRYGAVDGARCISGNRSIPGYSINHFGFRVVCSSSIEGFYSREGPRHPRLRPAGRAGLDTASPTPRPPASRGAFASRSCRNRGPSAWAASPTRCRCGARRQCPPAPCDRRAAGGRPSGAAVVRGARAPPMPRARRRSNVRLSAQATAPYRSREVSLRALNTSRVSVHPPSILSRHRQEPCRGWLRGPLRHESHNRAFPRCGGLQLTFCADSANKDPGQESHVTSPAAPAATGGKRAANRVGSLRRSGSRS
jgi:hypothetical protein